MDEQLRELTSVIQTWRERRVGLAGPFNQDGLRRFIETHNALTRRMIRVFDTIDPEFYTALLELTQNASTLVLGGKIVVNKIDRTNT